MKENRKKRKKSNKGGPRVGAGRNKKVRMS